MYGSDLDRFVRVNKQSVLRAWRSLVGRFDVMTWQELALVCANHSEVERRCVPLPQAAPLTVPRHSDGFYGELLLHVNGSAGVPTLRSQQASHSQSQTAMNVWLIVSNNSIGYCHRPSGEGLGRSFGYDLLNPVPLRIEFVLID